MSDKCRAIVHELCGFVNVYRGNVRAVNTDRYIMVPNCVTYF